VIPIQDTGSYQHKDKSCPEKARAGIPTSSCNKFVEARLNLAKAPRFLSGVGHALEYCGTGVHAHSPRCRLVRLLCLVSHTVFNLCCDLKVWGRGKVWGGGLGTLVTQHNLEVLGGAGDSNLIIITGRPCGVRVGRGVYVVTRAS
jgi:hypothetical protein